MWYCMVLIGLGVWGVLGGFRFFKMSSEVKKKTEKDFVCDVCMSWKLEGFKVLPVDNFYLWDNVAGAHNKQV